MKTVNVLRKCGPEAVKIVSGRKEFNYIFVANN